MEWGGDGDVGEARAANDIDEAGVANDVDILNFQIRGERRLALSTLRVCEGFVQIIRQHHRSVGSRSGICKFRSKTTLTVRKIQV